MFTGLIIELGEVQALDKQGLNAALSIKGQEILRDIAVGDSISINGVCLTVISFEKNVARFDVSGETLRNTNLGEFRRGSSVNLEPSLKPSSKLGGHFVTGHVEAVGRIRSRRLEGNSERIEIDAPESVLRYLVPKGSVAVDGISLTVIDVLKDAFSVVIIPHTTSMTTLGFKKTGYTINLEPDILAKYVARFLRNDLSNANSSGPAEADERFLSKLKDSGFI
jgi:riboflavin synthase